MPKSLNLSDKEVRDLSVGEKLCLCKRLKTFHTLEMSAFSTSVNAFFLAERERRHFSERIITPMLLSAPRKAARI